MGLFNNKTKTYDYAFECENCCEKVIHEVPKGITVSQYAKEELLNEKCEKCGCNFIQYGRPKPVPADIKKEE